MKSTPFLLASLSLNVVLLAAIGWLVEPEFSEPLKARIIGNGDLPGRLMPGNPAEENASDFREDKSEIERSGIAPQDNAPPGDMIESDPFFPDTVERSLNATTASDSSSSVSEPAISQHRARVVIATISRWAIHPRAQARVGSAQTAHPSEGNAALETTQPLLALKGATPEHEPSVPTLPKVVNVASVDGDPRLVEPSARGEPLWPQGLFTPEEELFRAHYGWTAFAKVLRDDALAPDR